ncbi:MAG: GNAT family N-acetyltransferase [Devosia sp.]
MNRILFNLLDANMGQEITHGLAVEIIRASSMLDDLIEPGRIRRTPAAEHKGFVFGVEEIGRIKSEVMPLHKSHWDETEEHRHDLPFDPDYTTFERYELAGRYILFTVRKDWRLVGNCAMYIDRSAHTQTLMATEDTLYILPEYRKGIVAKTLVGYVEETLLNLGVKEINITVKTVNRAGLFFQRLGYRHVENGLTKILGVKGNVLI